MNPPFRLDYNRAYIPLRKGWDNPLNEETLMHWLAAMLHAPCPVAGPLGMGGVEANEWRAPDGPFGPRDTGYRWQLDGSNDWWAEVIRYPETPDSPADLLLACRYEYQPLKELATWVAAKVGIEDES